MKLIRNLKSLRGRIFPICVAPLSMHPEADGRPIFSFIFVVLFYILHQLVMQPNWVLGGEMWAEMATNYYANANASSWLQKLFATDAGYIPLPQRLIALLGEELNIPADSIPYYYTWASIFLTGMLIGVFCLSHFRKVVESDYLRLLTSIAILTVADFETRTFINFTYFSAFFVTIITALALIDDSREVPWWAWFIPILMVSKPAVLAALPPMLLVALVSRPRFRLITLLTLLLVLGQITQMYVSATAGVMPFRANDITIASKLVATAKYFLGFLGLYITGPSILLDREHRLLAGLVILIFVTYRLCYSKSAANVLLFVGLMLLFFNVLINTFALSTIWNGNLELLNSVSIYRHIIVGFFGCVLIVCGIVDSAKGRITFYRGSRVFGNSGAFIFLTWFCCAGWHKYAGKINREPISPTVNSSQWKIMAHALESDVSHICIPINPWWKGANWMYHRNCELLEPPPAWENGKLQINDNLLLRIKPPATLFDKTLIAAAILLKPQSSSKSLVEVLMRFRLKNGNIVYFSGSKDLNASGGLLMLNGKHSITIDSIEDITLQFNLPVEVALGSNGAAEINVVAWMGY